MEGTSAYIIIINATFGWIICQELTNWNKSVHFRHFRMLYNALKMGQCDVKIQKKKFRHQFGHYTKYVVFRPVAP